MPSLGHLRLVYVFCIFILYFIKINVNNSFKNLTFYPNLNQAGNKYYCGILNHISLTSFINYLNYLCLQAKQNTPIRDKSLTPIRLCLIPKGKKFPPSFSLSVFKVYQSQGYCYSLKVFSDCGRFGLSKVSGVIQFFTKPKKD